MIYFVFLIISFFLVLVFTPIIIRFAKRLKLFDLPGGRKIHKKPVPRLGGIAIFLSFWITISIANFMFSNYLVLPKNLFVLFIVSCVFLLFSIYDDIRGIKAHLKLFLEIVGSIILITLGNFKITNITNQVIGNINFGFLSIPITILWIIYIMNAINLIDGMDGVAAGVVAISSFFLFLISNFQNNEILKFFSIILFGVNIGFLVFNFPPAKIFMGDCGSLFLGLIISVIAIIGNQKSSVAISFFVPIILLIFPIMDTILAIIRRILKGKNIFIGDREHLHHRLLNLGFSDRSILLTIYIICIYFGLISMLTLFIKPKFAFLIFILLLLTVGGLIVILESIESILKAKRD